MCYMEQWLKYILRLTIASNGTNVPGMKFLHEIVFHLLGKITEQWNIGHTGYFWPTSPSNTSYKESVGLSVQEKKLKIEFHEGGRGDHLGFSI